MITVYYCRDGGPMMDNPWPHQMGCGPYPTEAEAIAAMLAKVPGGLPETTAIDATDAVERWKDDAGDAGDDAMVATCERTLDGDTAALAAWCKVERTGDSSFSL